MIKDTNLNLFSYQVKVSLEFLNKYIVNINAGNQKEIEELYWYYNDGAEPPA